MVSSLFSMASIVVILLLLLGLRLRRPWLLVPHLLWQLSVLVLVLVWLRIVVSLSGSGEFELESAVVIGLFLAVLGFLDVWFLWVVACGVVYLRRNVKNLHGFLIESAAVTMGFLRHSSGKHFHETVSGARRWSM